MMKILETGEAIIMAGLGIALNVVSSAWYRVVR